MPVFRFLAAAVFMRDACHIIPLKKFVEKRGKGLEMLNMYREVFLQWKPKTKSALHFILIITGGAIGLEQQ
ncbi:hypothetical protein NYE80_26005 [Paenibacillus sp. FSL H7-0357]|uniref:hypothetical protein n=2 Tax=Paenibacillus TaxID=44249 RepID=UPI0030D4AB1B